MVSMEAMVNNGTGFRLTMGLDFVTIEKWLTIGMGQWLTIEQ